MAQRSLKAFGAAACILATFGAARLVNAQTQVPTGAQDIRLPVRVSSGSLTQSISLQATYYPASGSKPSPLAIINHGSTDGTTARTIFRSASIAQLLRQQGFSVLVPMRRGRGESEGSYGETSCCDQNGISRDCRPGIEEAIEDLSAAIAFGNTLSNVQAGPVLLTGQSRGGFLSVIYAGRHPDQVRGLVNFAGGWTAERCNGFFNQDLLGEIPSASKVPQMWIYGGSDSYYSARHIQANRDIMLAKGLPIELLLFSGEGHFVINSPQLWRAQFGQFLQVTFGAPAPRTLASIIPKDFTPDGTVAQQRPALAGLWEGSFGGVVDGMLQFDRIEGDVLHGVYGWRLSDGSEGVVRVSGSLSSSEIVLRPSSGRMTLTITPTVDGALNVVYRLGDRPASPARMVRKAG